MTKIELQRAINEPAHRAGLYLERGLVEAIIEEAGTEAGSLPLVAHALVETWVRRKGNTLTLEGFRGAGGVAGAISHAAMQRVARMSGNRRTGGYDGCIEPPPVGIWKAPPQLHFA